MRHILKSVALAALMLGTGASLNAQQSEPIQEPITEPIQEPLIGPREQLLLKNFYYFDHMREEMVRGEFMLIEDGIITSINTSEGLCPACDVMDLEGGFLIPGLMDLHQHLNAGGFAKETNKQKIDLLRRNFHWGITTVYNPNIKLPVLNAVRQAVAKNPRNYPEVFAAGQNIGPTGGWGDVQVSNYQEFKVAATRQLAGGADNIKISLDDMSWLSTNALPKLPDLLVRQAVALMHGNKRRLFVHATQARDVELATIAGADGIIHGTIDEAIPAPIVTQIVGKKTGYISTLALFETIAEPSKAVTAMRGYDPEYAMPANLYDNMSSDLMVMNWRDWWNESHLLKAKLPIVRGNTIALINAGALVGIGTDAGTPSIIFGASLPYEMFLHEQIGIHPLRVLKLATYNNARIMKIAHRTGTIQERREADLVLLKANPTMGIQAINSLVWTMQNGAITYRQELLGGN